MTRPFPVTAARNALVESVRSALCRKHQWPDSAAEALVTLHLDPDNFAMHRSCDTEKLIVDLRTGFSGDALREAITFEDTHSIRGICRVMVRTHLNRQGIGYVTRGEPRHARTLARRVLGPFDGNFAPQALTDWKNLLEHWLAFSVEHPELFDVEDMRSLEAMVRIGPPFGAAKKAYVDKAHDNWVKVVLGVYCGFNYLQKHFSMDAGKLWTAIERCESDRRAASALVKQARKEITGFGEALAPSFFADLGATCFIKPDTHLQQAMKAYSGRDVPKRQIVQILLDTADAAHPHIRPRALDKLLFFGDGGPLYFLGESVPKEQFQKALTEGAGSPP